MSQLSGNFAPRLKLYFTSSDVQRVLEKVDWGTHTAVIINRCNRRVKVDAAAELFERLRNETDKKLRHFTSKAKLIFYISK